jgi:hypothetical protein
MGSMGALGGLVAGASAFGSYLATGFMNTLAGTGFFASMSAAGSMLSAGSLAAGAGMAAGALLPVVGVILALPSIKKFLFGGGTQVVGGGLTGMLGGGEANVISFVDKYKSGGLLSSSKSWQEFGNLAPELDKFLNDSALAIINQTSMFAEMLNVNADRLAGMQLNFTRQFKGLSAEQQQEEIVKVLELYGELLARRLLGSLEEGTTDWLKDWVPGEFVKEGESASEALSRLASSLATVNQVFDTLNYAMFNAGLRSADMASKIIEAFGNAEAFVERTTYFYSEFYSESERVATTTRQLAAIMGELDLELPKTREQFRLLVESQDITTQSGRDMYAMLLNLAPTFAQISDSVEELYQKAQDATNTALQVLERSIAAQQEALRISERLAQQNVNAIESVFQVLNNAIRGLTGGGFTPQTGQAFISQALSNARGMGPLPSAEELQSAISAVSGGLTASSFRSEFEFRRAQAAFVSQLTELRGYTENQLTTAEQQLVAITEQISKLDEQLELARVQVNELRGINTSVLTVADAIYELNRSMAAEKSALETKQSASQGSSSSSTQTLIQTKKQKDADQLIMDLYMSGGYTLPKDGGDQSVFDGWARYADRWGNSRTIDIWEDRGNKGTTTATFAAGGMHDGGLRIVGERGPELEMTGPARYMSNANLAAMMGNGSNEEIKALREENKVQMRALVSLQNRMTKLLERWDGDGLPEERAVA